MARSTTKPLQATNRATATATAASRTVRSSHNLARPTRLSASKGEQTRALILDHALHHAAVHGFEAITIGTLAERTGLSKSGLFAHFGSKEELQVATLDEAVRRYNQAAFLPALAAPRGLKRLTSMFEHWIAWTETGELTACPMMAAAGEFDRREGPMRDAIEAHMRRLHLETAKSVEMVIKTGEFSTDTDPEQFAFELFGVIATFYRSRNLFRDPLATDRARSAFARMVESARPQSFVPARESRQRGSQKARR
jgi:AcrR family transcriptional regulator